MKKGTMIAGEELEKEESKRMIRIKDKIEINHRKSSDIKYKIRELYDILFGDFDDWKAIECPQDLKCIGLFSDIENTIDCEHKELEHILSLINKINHEFKENK